MYMIFLVFSLALVFYSIFKFCYKKGNTKLNMIFLLLTSLILYTTIYNGVLKMIDVHNAMM